MNDYTPPTEQVREIYAEIRHESTRLGLNPHRAEFDRWMEQVKAEAWDEGFTDGVNHDLGDWDNAPSIINNPYRQETDA